MRWSLNSANPGPAAPKREQPGGSFTDAVRQNLAIGKLQDFVSWGRSNSVWPFNFGLSCCYVEMATAFTSKYDIARFGMETFRASPRQADLMIVAGRLSQKMAPVLRNVYDQMMEPKWVIAMGVCASSGGMFNNYALVQGVDQIVPVDMYTPGCPPGPETLLHSIIALHDHIRTGEIMQRRSEGRGAGLQAPSSMVRREPDFYRRWPGAAVQPRPDRGRRWWHGRRRTHPATAARSRRLGASSTRSGPRR